MNSYTIAAANPWENFPEHGKGKGPPFQSPVPEPSFYGFAFVASCLLVIWVRRSLKR